MWCRVLQIFLRFGARFLFLLVGHHLLRHPFPIIININSIHFITILVLLLVLLVLLLLLILMLLL